MAFLLCASLFTVSATAAEVTQAGTATKYLIPVGHTVGIKLFARGVLVTELSQGDTPARDCGLKTGDVILQCNGQSIRSTEEFQSQLAASKGGDVALRQDPGSDGKARGGGERRLPPGRLGAGQHGRHRHHDLL